MAAPGETTLSLIERLVAFDSTSRNSNLDLIDFVRGYLQDLGVDSHLVHCEEGRKANLYATVGPADRAGIALSGHTDVVPVDGQDWTSDPFRVERRDARLFGRGTADMKSFLAVCLALVPEMLERGLRTPIHLSFTYDEEVGCIGVRRLIEWLRRQPVIPRACVIGEPTGMRVIRAHKGKESVRARVRGLACHSALAHQGVNAVEAAAEVIAQLKSMARRFRDRGPYDAGYDPPYTTVHTGLVRGGTALNIVPEACEFEFEFRYLPEQDPEALLSEVTEFAARELLPEMRAVDPRAGFEWQRLTAFAGLDTDEEAEVVTLAKGFARVNDTGKVSFGTEGGLLQQAGIPTVICGPGHIAQAHKADEFVDLDQIAACEAFVRRVIERAASAPD